MPHGAEKFRGQTAEVFGQRFDIQRVDLGICPPNVKLGVIRVLAVHDVGGRDDEIEPGGADAFHMIPGQFLVAGDAEFRAPAHANPKVRQLGKSFFVSGYIQAEKHAVFRRIVLRMIGKADLLKPQFGGPLQLIEDRGVAIHGKIGVNVIIAAHDLSCCD